MPNVFVKSGNIHAVFLCSSIPLVMLENRSSQHVLLIFLFGRPICAKTVVYFMESISLVYTSFPNNLLKNGKMDTGRYYEQVNLVR